MLKLLRRRVANEAGFTLMELIVVVLIVGILAAVGVPLYLGYVRDSRLAEAKAVAPPPQKPKERVFDATKLAALLDPTGRQIARQAPDARVVGRESGAGQRLA